MNLKFKPDELNFDTFCERAYEEDPTNMFPGGITDSEALKVLHDYFFPKGYYLGYSASHSQANTEFVAYMLKTYDKDKKLSRKIARLLRAIADKIDR